MKFLICGIGSIGQRHYKNLVALGHEVAVLRSGVSTQYHQSFLEEFFKGEKEHGREVQRFFNWEEALSVFNPEAIFVTNPNSHHLSLAIPAAEARKHIFIEKPVASRLDGLSKLEELQRKNKLVVTVGYNFRFHPLLQKMKELCEGGVIGKIIAANVEMGENIEDWHPWEDYRESYAPWKEGGGGVTLCFSHDIHYLYWFLGMPHKIQAIGGKLTSLGGDAEDVVKALLEFENGAIASLHLDYWQRPPRRSFEILGAEGKMIWDYYSKTLTLLPHRKGAEPEIWTDPEGFDRNSMFIDEVKNFIDAIKKNQEPAITLREGRDVLKIALEITHQLPL